MVENETVASHFDQSDTQRTAGGGHLRAGGQKVRLDGKRRRAARRQRDASRRPVAAAIYLTNNGDVGESKFVLKKTPTKSKGLPPPPHKNKTATGSNLFAAFQPNLVFSTCADKCSDAFRVCRARLRSKSPSATAKLKWSFLPLRPGLFPSAVTTSSTRLNSANLYDKRFSSGSATVLTFHDLHPPPLSCIRARC